jgi:isopenicillin N synthase-like dioxygenase
MEKVPTVDFAPFFSNTLAGKQMVADAIGTASEGIGFFYLANHGMPAGVTDAIFASARRFFALPIERRIDPAILISPEHSRGYQPLGARFYPGTAEPDQMQAFKYQRELPDDDPDILAGDRIQQLNKWPEGLPGWRASLLDYFEAVDGVAMGLLRAFALALDLEENYFLNFFRKPLTQVSLLHYPPAPVTKGLYGNRPHMDETAFTIVLQEDMPGLEVETASGLWIDVPPIKDSLVINIGDYMARWTNDRYRSTRHRVVNRIGKERYSVPYFAIPDFDAVINCLPSCQGPDNPPKYPPLPVGPAIQRKFSGDYVD